MKKLTILLAVTIMYAVIACTSCNRTTNDSTQPYTWKNVRIVGAGFVTGFVFHPAEPGLRYCRTDMGGAYRWEEQEQVWVPLLDWLSYADLNLMGVESIALDPNDPDKLFMACGTYTNPSTPDGAILWSGDRGKTFNRTDVPFKMGGNENGRGNGERMMVDPNNGKIIYMGTRNNGLWRSIDGAESWEQVTSFPDVSEPIPEGGDRRNRWIAMRNRGSGVIFVVFDSNSLQNGKSQKIYVGASLMGRENLFMSEDGGETWSPVPGHPLDFRPTHGILASNDILYMTYGTNPGPNPMTDGAVWKYNTHTGEWTEITPDDPDPENDRGFGYAAVSVDASNPDVLVVTSYHRYSAGGDEIFRSLDGGQTWKPVFESGVEFDYGKAPYVHHTGVHWMFDIEIDPFDPDHALFTTGYGGHETFNLTNLDRGDSITWHIMSTGIEESVPLDLLSPPEGGQLLTAIGDYCGFLHFDLDNPVPEGCFENPHFGNTDGISCAEQKPSVIVRVGIESARPADENIAYSEDGGITWNPTASMPFENAMHGHIAVSADGKTWIWTPQRSRPFVTSDKGATWTEITSLPENVKVIADRIDPRMFYTINIFEGKLFTSTDGGLSFVATDLDLEKGIPEPNSFRGDRRGGQDRIYATPGLSGDLWIAAFDGLYHAVSPENGFELMDQVEEIHAFGFGKGKRRNSSPSLFMVGTVNGTRGIFRSDDEATNWVRINDDAHEWGLLMHITGDPKKYGRVYVGTHGRGAIYGDPK
ncbi:exo-alpha-sialidase [Bacteroidota bacterium]